MLSFPLTTSRKEPAFFEVAPLHPPCSLRLRMTVESLLIPYSWSVWISYRLRPLYIRFWYFMGVPIWFWISFFGSWIFIPLPSRMQWCLPPINLMKICIQSSPILFGFLCFAFPSMIWGCDPELEGDFLLLGIQSWVWCGCPIYWASWQNWVSDLLPWLGCLI